MRVWFPADLGNQTFPPKEVQQNDAVDWTYVIRASDTPGPVLGLVVDRKVAW